MKVYLVTTGCYSDYKVAGVYSTMKKAELARKLAGHDANPIDEFELDAIPEHPPGMLLFGVKMDKDGNVISWKTCDSESSKSLYEWRPWNCDLIRFSMWARDSDRAIKIANEKRLMLIASGQWTTDWDEWRKLGVGLVVTPSESEQQTYEKTTEMANLQFPSVWRGRVWD